MFVKIRDVEYRVYWTYKKEDEFRKGVINFFKDSFSEEICLRIASMIHEADKTPRSKVVTICNLVNTNTGEIDFSGKTICSSKDTFVKEIGRKKSLADALFGFKKEDRKPIWDKYFSR